jgi:UDP-N-acetylmuramoylalanine-D-glutamate ligase
MPKTGEYIYKELCVCKTKKLFGIKIQKIFLVEDLNEAIQVAKEVTNGICLLSPAASSYEYFKNFEERGNLFKELVR